MRSLSNKAKSAILFITHEDDKYGAARSLLAIVSALKETEFLPIVVTCRDNQYSTFCKEHGIKTFRLKYKRCTTSESDLALVKLIKRVRHDLLNYISCKKIMKIIRSENVRIVHTNTIIMDLGMFSAKKMQIPHVWHIREYLDLDFGQEFLSKKQIERIDNSGSYFICISEAIRRHWQYKGLRNNLRVIYNGVQVDANFKKNDNKDRDSVKILFVGHITKNKGQEMLIEACRLLERHLLNSISIDIYGNGEQMYVDHLKKKVFEYRLDGVVHFKGFCSNMNENFSKYDIGIVASKAEGFGRVTIEYMLSGLCVLASDTGANPEIIGVDCGMLFEFGNTEDFANKLRLLITDEALRHRLADTGKQNANKRFREKTYTDNCIKLYRELVNGNEERHN